MVRKGVLITGVTVSAARDRSYELTFTAIPYSERYGYRFTIKQPSRMQKRQRQHALISALVVVQFDYFDFLPGVGGVA